MTERRHPGSLPSAELVPGPAQRVRIYIRESDQGQHGPLFLQVLDVLHRNGGAGATVIRAIAGFGTHGPIQTMNILDVSTDLPLIIEYVASEAFVAQMLPQVQALIPVGLITVEPVQVVKYARQRHSYSEKPAPVLVREVMSTAVTTLAPTAPVAEVMQALLTTGYFKTIPIVDPERHVLGVVTDGDLLRRSDIPLHVKVSSTASTAELQQLLTQLRRSAKTAANLMTRPVVTFPADLPVAEAIAQMAARRLKRVPIVNPQNQLVGILGRLDILRLAAGELRPGPASSPTGGASPATPDEKRAPTIDGQRTVGEVMVADVVTVRPETGLAQVLDQLVHSTLRRLVVVDAQGHICGVISETDLLTRLGQQPQPAILRALATALPFLKQPTDLQAQVHRLENVTAAVIMTRTIITITPDRPLVEAVDLMLVHHIRFLPVVEPDGRLVGIVRRGDLMRAASASLEEQP